LSDTTKDTINIKIRGKGFIGQERTITSPTENATTKNVLSKPELFLSIGVILILYIAFMAFYLGYIRKRRLTRADYGELDFNNYGFRLLHIGKYQEAKKYIQLSIDKEPGVYNLGNMAHIIALEGDFKTAKEFYEIARDYDSDKGSNAFLYYCGFCINLLNDDKEKALSDLARALELGRKRITNYINRNNNLGKWKDDKDILQLIYKSS
jgi:tetratricopeptide (TPR) repeat protein